LTFAAEAAWKRHVIDAASKGADGVRLADANGDGLPDIATGWEQGGTVRVCLNPGPAKAKEKWPAVTVGRAGDVEDAVLVDLDGDGALDVVSCSEGKTRQLWIHWAPKSRADYMDAAAWRTEPLPGAADKMMWMFALPLQVNGRHGVDLIAGGKNQGAAIGWFAAPEDARNLADWTWHELRPVGWLMSLVTSDMDGDGDTDIVFTDRKGARSGCGWLENPGPGAVQAKPWREHAIGGAGAAAMFLHLADLDRDGLEDVLVSVQPKEIRWLRRLDRSGKSWRAHSIPLPENTGIAKSVNAADLDGDGRLDLVFSCEQAKAPNHGLMWLSHDGSPAGRWTPHELSGVDGVKHDLVALVDLDGDGDLDAITTEEVKNLGVIWYENPLKQP
jgi:FG-GAP-like repeat